MEIMSIMSPDVMNMQYDFIDICCALITISES